MAAKKSRTKAEEKKITRYSYEEVKEPRTPETGHTALLPADEQVVTLPMDNGWSKAIEVGKLPEGDKRPVVVDMDPAADPVLFWAGKRNKRNVPILPLQRNEIVSESRIAQIAARAQKAAAEKDPLARQGRLFADLEKVLRESDKGKRVEFYTHDEGWKNKLICGDSLHSMESLLHYEGLHGKVQMIYIDPPYGIKYDSNFQQRIDSTTNDQNDMADDVLTIKAFHDTWALGIHSYLSYLQERIYLCRELLAQSGSIFIQISLENVHLVRALLDEVFGSQNFCDLIAFKKTPGLEADLLSSIYDFCIWYAKDKSQVRYQQLYIPKRPGEPGAKAFTWVESPDGKNRRKLTEEEMIDPSRVSPGWRIFGLMNPTSYGFATTTNFEFEFEGRKYRPPSSDRRWRTTSEGMENLVKANRLIAQGKMLWYKAYLDDFAWNSLTNAWDDTAITAFSSEQKWFVVQTPIKVVTRAILMTTFPGDLAFDPTCGGGTTAWVAECWGRRWITCDTSRVAINVTRRRLLSAIYDHYKTHNGRVSGGFVYKNAPHVTLKSIAHDMESERIDLVDHPEIEKDALRVCGPFEVMSLGRYSLEDWKGYVVREEGEYYGEPAKLENYIQVICRLYRKDAAVQEASGLVHAIAESEKEKIAISVGPLSGRVTAKQINDAVQDAISLGILEVHILGWAFEANVGEVKSHLESRGKVKVELIMIRPDTLAEGLKITKGETLFSPLALPDIEVKVSKNGKKAPEATVILKGVALFDRKTRTTEYHHADSGYISAWYLDEDYDGDCFVDCQMFFDFKKAPNLKATLRVEVDPDEYKLQLTSNPFPVQNYKRLAVKVVDVYGNESTVVRDLM
jgi:adenine-specific DNA-methyltransferase